MRAGDTVLFAEGASDLEMPLIFVIPPVMDWAMAVERDANLRDSIDHPIGSRQLTLTQVTIANTTSNIEALGVSTGKLRFEVGSVPLASLALDDGSR